jgi:hypothetical protein
MENNRQKCPVCGVFKAWDPNKEQYEFETWASRNLSCSNMSPSAFNTKCCQYVKKRGKPGCINDSDGYDARYDHTRTDIIQDMTDKKVLELRKKIIKNKEES